ncbi:MAG: winged-helix domain-containing protein [Thermoplasmata archaeon]
MGEQGELGEEALPKGGGGLTRRLQTPMEILQRHVLMLRTIKQHGPIGIIRLAELLKHPQHKIRYSLRILEQEGLIRPSPEGAVVTEKVGEFLPRMDALLSEMETTIKKVRESLGPLRQMPP